jgi:hypothetical protein
LADAPRARRLSISPRYVPQSKEIGGIIELIISAVEGIKIFWRLQELEMQIGAKVGLNPKEWS